MSKAPVAQKVSEIIEQYNVRNATCLRECTPKGEKGRGKERKRKRRPRGKEQVQSFVLWSSGVGKERLHRSASDDTAFVLSGARSSSSGRP
jgi:hypothetical protein